MIWIGVLGSTSRMALLRRQTTVGKRIFSLTGSLHHNRQGLAIPTINEVTVSAVRCATRKCQGRRAVPSLLNDFSQVVTDGEAETGDSFLALGASVGGAVGDVGVSVFGNIVRVDAVVEVEEVLEVSGACFFWESGWFFVGWSIIFFAIPCSHRMCTIEIMVG